MTRAGLELYVSPATRQIKNHIILGLVLVMINDTLVRYKVHKDISRGF